MNKTKTLALILLTTFSVLSFTSMWNDTAIVDEGPHLPSGYSYLTQKDMRLNPEHPPLMKDLAALPLLFMDINFPSQIRDWNENVNGQWGFGHYFLYEAGNDAQTILRLGRIMMVLFGILLGFFIFKIFREFWGGNIGLLALTFYAFSPTFLAHTRFVTTDVGAAASFLVGFYYLHKWLKIPTQRNLWVFGLILGLALLTKFSTFLLLPIFGLIVFVWFLLNAKGKFGWALKTYIGGFILPLVMALFVVDLIYVWHVWNYPILRQVQDTTYTLTSFGFRPAADFVIWLASSKLIILRALGEYLLGLSMVVQRSAGGNTTYYLGEISGTGSISYFPLMYLIKEPTAYILFAFFALWFFAKRLKDSYSNVLKNLRINVLNNFTELSMLVIIAIYWFFSIRSNLNIGVRHLIPILPFIYGLTARQIGLWVHGGNVERISNYRGFFQILGIHWRKFKRAALVCLFLFWAILSVIWVFPSFLAYFNELAGGPNGGYRIVTDSNLDWGQDLLRLDRFIKKNNIQKIKVDYFGGGDVKYYLGDKAEFFDRESPQKGWLAVSATFLQGACRGNAGSCAYDERAYTWLDQHKPVAKIGYSIFVYYIE